MNIDPREQRRRAWRIIGRAVWKDLIIPALLIVGLAAAVFFGSRLWSIHPLMLIAPAAVALVVVIGSLVWDWAENKARTQLTHEKLTELTQEDDQ